MGFSAKQVKALRRNLDHRYVRTREANGRELSYIEGWYAISEANRIFGFDGWSRETVESRCVLARENRGAFLAVYTARVRISVQTGATMPPSGPWPPLANRSGSPYMESAGHHPSGQPYPSHLLRQNPPSAWAFIPMIQHQFHGRRVTTAVANMPR